MSQKKKEKIIFTVTTNTQKKQRTIERFIF
jgi:hypothetical protein